MPMAPGRRADRAVRGSRLRLCRLARCCDTGQSARQKDRAATLAQQMQNDWRERFDDAFWCDDLSTYALALDGSKQPCKVRTSTAGQCLFTGIVMPNRAGRLARTFDRRNRSPAGAFARFPKTEARYNPMAYHNGAVWPHDNALIALGWRVTVWPIWRCKFSMACLKRASILI